MEEARHAKRRWITMNFPNRESWRSARPSPWRMAVTCPAPIPPVSPKLVLRSKPIPPQPAATPRAAIWWRLSPTALPS